MKTMKFIAIGWGIYGAIVLGSYAGSKIGEGIKDFKKKHKIGDSWYEKNYEIIDQVAVESD